MTNDDETKMPEGMTWGEIAKCTLTPGVVYLSSANNRAESFIHKTTDAGSTRMALGFGAAVVGEGCLLGAAGCLGLFGLAASALCSVPALVVASWAGLNLVGFLFGASLDGAVLTEKTYLAISSGEAFARLREFANTPARKTLGFPKKPELKSEPKLLTNDSGQ